MASKATSKEQLLELPESSADQPGERAGQEGTETKLMHLLIAGDSDNQ